MVCVARCAERGELHPVPSDGTKNDVIANHAPVLPRLHCHVQLSLSFFTIDEDKLEEYFKTESGVVRVSKSTENVANKRRIQHRESVLVVAFHGRQWMIFRKDVLLKRKESELDEQVFLKKRHLNDFDSHVEHLRGHGIHGGWFARPGRFASNDLDDSLRTTSVQGNSCDVPRLSTVYLIVGKNILFVQIYILDCIFNCR